VTETGLGSGGRGCSGLGRGGRRCRGSRKGSESFSRDTSERWREVEGCDFLRGGFEVVVEASQAGVIVNDMCGAHARSGAFSSRRLYDEDSGIAWAVGEKVLERIGVLMGRKGDSEKKGQSMKSRETPPREDTVGPFSHEYPGNARCPHFLPLSEMAQTPARGRRAVRRTEGGWVESGRLEIRKAAQESPGPPSTGRAGETTILQAGRTERPQKQRSR